MQLIWLALLVILAIPVYGEYNSSINNIKLDALVFDNHRIEKEPILVIMHAYHSATANDLVDVAQRFADKGIFVIVPDLRGRKEGDESALQIGDDSMYELFDIYDAIQIAIEEFNADGNNVNILGYSGGGANALQMVQKFPDLFNNAYSFFGIPNYCDGNTTEDYSWYNDKSYYNYRLEKRIGNGSTDLFELFPNRCLARNALKQIPNNKKTHIELFVDEDEKIAPLKYSAAYLEAYQRSGFSSNVELNTTNANSTYRYKHGYPREFPDLKIPEARISEEILSGAINANASLPIKDTLHIGGYIKTKPFTVLLGEEIIQNGISKGREGMVEMQYDLKEQTFTFTDKSYNAPFVRNVTLILHSIPLGNATYYKINGIEMQAIADHQGNAKLVIPLKEEAEANISQKRLGLTLILSLILVLAVAYLIYSTIFKKKN